MAKDCKLYGVETSVIIPKFAWSKKPDNYWHTVLNIDNADRYNTIIYDDEEMELYDDFTSCDGEDMLEFRTNKEPQKDIEFWLSPIIYI